MASKSFIYPSYDDKWKRLRELRNTLLSLKVVAGPTRLELATSGVTGRRSNQLNYDPVLRQKKTNGCPWHCQPSSAAQFLTFSTNLLGYLVNLRE